MVEHNLVSKWPDDYRQQWPNFSIAEMQCKCGCGLLPNRWFMRDLQRLRRALGFPFPVTSGARCPDYDKAIDGAGVHPFGAADINLWGLRVYQLQTLATMGGAWTGIGLLQHGDYSDRFIHLDQLPYNSPDAHDYDPDKHPRPWIWTYK